MNRRMALAVALILAALVTCPLAAMGPGGGGGMTKAHVGKMIYCDSNLSTPTGQSCQSCHHPMAGYADPNSDLPVSAGVIAGRFGNRNSPVSAYLATVPDFHFDMSIGGYVGGQFWDGRAKNLVEQAKGPFLNPLEMNNPSKSAVVNKVKASCYATGFKQIYGQSVFGNVENAYKCIADALASYEKSSELNRYDSKYDQYLAGAVSLTEQESRGLELFEGRAGCSSCHTPPTFTNFTYHNAGIPRNPDNPFYFLSTKFNPLGQNWKDKGLGGFTGKTADIGKFKTPTLRNIAATAPYTHNGLFNTLYEVVDFKNTRDVANWPDPEHLMNVDNAFGNLGLSDQDIDDIVAFLYTLSDSSCCGGGGCGGGMGG